jgi:hypothetical protein
MAKFDRYEKIIYQVKKSLVQQPTDEEKVEAVRDIYDVAINSGDEAEISTRSFPTEIMGVSIDWNEDNSGFIATKGTYSVNDILTDQVEPDVEDTSSYLQVNGEMFTVNGQYLSIA